jgi:small subunit ribosomal protein S8
MDPIADMLTIIKNGYLARKQFVTLPSSNIKEKIAGKLLEAGFVGEVTALDDKRVLKVELLYKDKEPVLTEVKRISRPSMRIYAPSNKIPRILGGRGEVIISTPKGILIGTEAKKAKVGGELLLKVW